MGNLPKLRPRTYVNGNPLIPEDINEVFDAIIDKKQPNVWSWWAPDRAPGETAIQFRVDTSGGGAAPGEYQGFITSAAPGSNAEISGPLRNLEVGDKLTDLGIWLSNPSTAAPGVHVTLYRSDLNTGATFTQIANWFPGTVPGGASVYTKFTFTLPTPEIVLDGYMYLLNIILPNTYVLAGIGRAKERP